MARRLVKNVDIEPPNLQAAAVFCYVPLASPMPTAAHRLPGPRPPAKSPQAGYSREAVLTAAVFLLLGLFAVTAFASRMYHKTFHALADQWYSAGEAAFQSKNVPEAITDLRNALIYSPNNTMFQFRLAQALSAAGHGDQAESYLLNLLSESPGGGPVNLELARIAARRKSDMADALRYYHAAIYGVWDSDPLIARWEVRRELCEFLLSRGTTRQAEPELIALADNVPPNDAARARIAAEYLLRGQLWRRALTAFQASLDANHNDREVLSDAGTAAFHLAEYPQTTDFLSKIPAEDRSESETDMLETSRRVLELDPFFTSLSAKSRAAIATRDFEIARSHAQDCAKQHGQPLDSKSLAANVPQSDLQRLFAKADSMKSAWTERMLERNPDRIHDAMALVVQMENETVSSCGQMQGTERALWLLGQAQASAAAAAPPTTGNGAAR